MAAVRIGGGLGFYGDRLDPSSALIERGDLQFLAFDHLAELTMAILEKDRARDPAGGFTKDLVPLMKALLPEARRQGVRLVTNAGGLNPKGARRAVQALACTLGMTDLKIAAVTGDDLLPRIDELLSEEAEVEPLADGVALADVRDRLLFLNAYLGAQPIVDVLNQGAELVITGRTSDSAQFLGPLRYAFGWAADDWDRLAGGIVVGHLLECAGQVTGGNFSGDWWNIPELDDLGFPIAEVEADGSTVITKPPGTGGRVSRDTVREQLLYEVHDPSAYLTPDVVVDFTTVRIEEIGKDRVRVWGARGRPAPAKLKLLGGYANGYSGEGIMGYAWPHALAKARAAESIIRRRIERERLRVDGVNASYLGYDSLHGPLSDTIQGDALNEVYLRMAARTSTREEAMRFERLFPPLTLDGPPFVGGLARPGPVHQLLGLWSGLIPRQRVERAVEFTVEEGTAP